jgi:hypothetical protein
MMDGEQEPNVGGEGGDEQSHPVPTPTPSPTPTPTPTR